MLNFKIQKVSRIFDYDHLLQRKPFKSDENLFFHLTNLFHSQDISSFDIAKILSWLFGHVEKTAQLER